MALILRIISNTSGVGEMLYSCLSDLSVIQLALNQCFWINELNSGNKNRLVNGSNSMYCQNCLIQHVWLLKLSFFFSISLFRYVLLIYCPNLSPVHFSAACSTFTSEQTMALRKSWTELDSEAISQREPGFTPNSVFKSDPIYDVVY